METMKTNVWKAALTAIVLLSVLLLVVSIVEIQKIFGVDTANPSQTRTSSPRATISPLITTLRTATVLRAIHRTADRDRTSLPAMT